MLANAAQNTDQVQTLAGAIKQSQPHLTRLTNRLEIVQVRLTDLQGGLENLLHGATSNADRLGLDGAGGPTTTPGPPAPDAVQPAPGTIQSVDYIIDGINDSVGRLGRCLSALEEQVSRHTAL